MARARVFFARARLLIVSKDSGGCGAAGMQASELFEMFEDSEDDEEFEGLIRDHLILPYLFRDIQPPHIQEYAGGLLFTLEKPPKDGGGIRFRMRSRVLLT